MSSKILLFIYFVGVSRAVFIDPHNDFSTSSLSDEEHNKSWKMVKMYHPPTQYNIEQHAYPKYEFEYAVSDKNTGDHKHHHETRDGDRVRGVYSIVEPDGSLRKVEYNADDHNGFKAVVSKTIHKHGDHAVSVFGHTRYFYPVGQGVKINRYFPGKDYYHNYAEKVNDQVIPKESKPVQEIQQEVSISDNDDPKPVLNEIKTKGAQIETENVREAIEEIQIPISNGEPTKVTSFNVVPAIVTMMVNEDGNKDTVIAPTNDKLIEETPTEEKTQTNEDQKPKTEDPSSYHDSETASSYSHSRFYYAF